MATENNWLKSNLNDRLSNPFLDYKSIFTPTPFKKLSFEEASIDAAYKIANNYENFYISLSGGLDSEYIMMVFYNLKIPFIPIIIKFEDIDHTESEYAFYICKKLNLNPVILTVNENIIFDVYRSTIHKNLNGNGINCAFAIIAGKYVEKKGGTLLTGEVIKKEGNPNRIEATLVEWEFYKDYILKIPTLGFLLYTPEIVYAIVNAFDNSERQNFKSKLYNLNYRPKIIPNYSSNIITKYQQLLSSIKKPQYKEILGEKTEFLNFMNKWN